MNLLSTFRLALPVAIAVAAAALGVAAPALGQTQKPQPVPVQPVPVIPVTPDPATTPAPRLKLLDPLPEPGVFVEIKTDKKLGITDAWLENGIRVHHRFQDNPPGIIFLSATLAGGPIEETAENAGISQAAGVAVNNTATSRLTTSQFMQLTIGKSKTFGATAFDDAFTIESELLAENLEAVLQQIHVVITDAKIDPEALASWKHKNLKLLNSYSTRLQYLAAQELEDLISGGDPRRTYLTKERINAPTTAQAQAWWDRLCREAPIEFAISGDIKLEQAMPLIQRYIGSLPKRSRTAEHLKELRQTRRPKGPLTRKITVKSTTAQAIVIAGFMGCEGWNLKDTRAMQMASMILDVRVAKNLRDDKQLTPSIRTRTEPATAYEDSGRFRSFSRCSPDNVDALTKAIFASFQQFGREGPRKQEMEKALEMLQRFHDLTVMGNSYFPWIILKHQDLHRRYLKDEMEAMAAYKLITPDEIKTVFSKYNTPERRFTIIAMPEALEKPTPDEKPDGKPTPLPNKPAG